MKFNECLTLIKLPKYNTFDLRFDDIKLEKRKVETPQNIAASVVKFSDKMIYEAIITFAKEYGFTDIYLMDEEFVITALKNEIERRKNNG